MKPIADGKLDATHYKWEKWDRAAINGPFDFLKPEKLPVAVKDVVFDEDSFELTDWHKNGIHFSFYGAGRIGEHAAVLCEDGTILFCIVDGYRFTDTFHSADDISMEYYTLTEIK